MDISDRIKIARIRCGLTQELLTEKINVSGSTVARWEQGKSEPRAAELAALSDVLGVSTDYLIKGVEPADVIKENSGVVISKNENTTVGNITNAPAAPAAVPPIPPLPLEMKYDKHGCPTTQYWASIVDEALRMSDNPSIYRHRNAAAIQDALYGLVRAEAVIRHIISTDPICHHLRDDASLQPAAN